MDRWIKRLGAGIGCLAVALASAPIGAASAATTTSPLGAFYTYDGTTPLAQIPPGTPLRTRMVSYSIQGIPLPLEAIQVLYRTRNQVGEPTVNVTTVVRPPLPSLGGAHVLSYQSFYDSLNPADEPSVVIAGGSGAGAGGMGVETALFAPALLAGDTINIPDTEGQTADFAAGPEYGYTTLDSLRAIAQVPTTGTSPDSKIAMLGYSGGAIATEWAAELAPTYAPDVAKRLVGSAFGGVFVDPIHNLHYVSGSLVWAGVLPMAVIGIARSFNIDLTPYLSDYGKTLYTKMQKAPITSALGQYPGLTWEKLAKPQYANPTSIPILVQTVNTLIMGTGGTPTSPLYIGQGTGGYLEGTTPSATYGAGDGVMLAGDVRALAREYCSRGVSVNYQEFPGSHFTTVPLWLPGAYAWIQQQLAGATATNNCGSIAPGNSIAPIAMPTSQTPAPPVTRTTPPANPIPALPLAAPVAAPSRSSAAGPAVSTDSLARVSTHVAPLHSGELQWWFAALAAMAALASVLRLRAQLAHRRS